MKKILTLLVLALVLFTACGKKETISKYDEIVNRGYLIVGVKTDSKPFGFIDDETNTNAGFDIDVAKYIAQDILGSERRIKFISVTPNTKIETLTSGEADLIIATMSITPQRALLIDFSTPYYVAGQSALVKEDSNIHTFSDLKDKRTIVVLGSTAEKNIRRIIPLAKIIGYKNYKEAFTAFSNGEADAISTDDTILSGFLTDHKGYRMLKNKITKEAYAVGIRKSDDESDDKLKRNVNIIITRMQKDGTLKNLKKKWNLK